MATRPIFIPGRPDESNLVVVRDVEFTWHPGFAASQKQKNIEGMRDAAADAGIHPVLEVSSKSPTSIGRELSAFSLTSLHPVIGRIALESAFQGSKVFEAGGPFTDLYREAPIVAKKDERLRSSGGLVRFDWSGEIWPLEPRTAFYDWLYLRALSEVDDPVKSELLGYSGFTDVEFNPKRSINCQARSCALYVALVRRGIDADDLEHPKEFLAAIDLIDRLF